MHSRRKFPGTLSLNSAAGSNSLLVRRYFRRAINISGKSSEKKEVVLSVLNPARSTLAFNSDRLYRHICREYSSILLQRKECCGTLEEYHPLGALPGTFARGLIHHPQCVLVRQKRRSHQTHFRKVFGVRPFGIDLHQAVDRRLGANLLRKLRRPPK